MSLVVWLPLNGNLNNHGLSNVNMVNTGGATVDSSGKIGQCYYFNGSTYLTESNYDWTNFNPNTFSLCCWYKEPSVASGNSQMICIGTNSGWNNIRIGLLRRTSNGYPMFSVSDGTNNVNYNFTATSFPLNVWNHIAITFDNGTMTMYLNGEFHKTSTTTIRPVLNSTQHLGVGAASNGAENLLGYLNDVRIYDHCLSAREVKEISKALVAHYKLDATDRINPNLVAASEERRTPEGSTSSNEYAAVCNTLPIFNTYGLVPYTVSFDIKAAVAHSFNIYATSGSNPKYTFTAKSINVTTEWQHITYTFTPRISTESGTWSRISVYGTYGSGAIVSLRNVKLELGEVETPFGTDSGVLSDVSGYKNNGTIVGTLSVANDSARYRTCLTFANNKYVAIGRGGMVKDAITVAWWGYMSNWSSYGRAISCTESGGWNFEAANSAIRFAININGTYVLAPDTSTFAQIGAGWHHFAGTFDRTNVKLYRDGNLITTTAAPTANKDIKYHATNGIFIGAEAAASDTTPTSPYFPGKLSDVRIYATALSDEDIYDLVHTSAYIDNLSDQMMYELVETSENIFTSENIIKYRNSSAAGSGEWGVRNGEVAILIQPNKFYANSVFVKVLEYEFKPNTRYVFDMWIDTDSVIYNNANRQAGLIVYYSDNTTDYTLSFVGGNLGFVHKRLITPAGKSVAYLNIYYYTSVIVYYRWDSTITEYKSPEVSIKKTGILETGNSKEYPNRENASYVKGGLIETREENEI